MGSSLATVARPAARAFGHSLGRSQLQGGGQSLVTLSAIQKAAPARKSAFAPPFAPADRALTSPLGVMPMTLAGEPPLLCAGGGHSPRRGLRNLPCGCNILPASAGDSSPDPRKPQGGAQWPSTRTNVSNMAGSRWCDPLPQLPSPSGARPVASLRDECLRRRGSSRSATEPGQQLSTTRRGAATSRRSSAHCL